MSEPFVVRTQETGPTALTVSSQPLVLPFVREDTQVLLRRMFADPRVLEKDEKEFLVAQLSDFVEQYPNVSELRVLYGMALCVNLEVQDAMEELGEAVALDPDSFIANLKMGELWMRLRVMQKAENHTQRAAQLAQNIAQSDLARRQAATIRTMRREGIERSGYASKWMLLARLKRLWTRSRTEELAPLEAR